MKKELTNYSKCLFPSYIAITLFVIVLFIYDYNLENKDKECILPERNTDNTTLNNCPIYTACNFQKINDTYELISDTVMLHPTLYDIGYSTEFVYSCPLYRELPGYKANLHNNCDNIGYGCCIVPLDTVCSQIMAMHKNNNQYAGFLYDKITEGNYKKHYLDIPKIDSIGSNCPKVQDLLCESFHTKLYYLAIHLCIIQSILTILICCLCINTDIFYKKIEYDTVDSNSDNFASVASV